jgi:DegV family protein with EDD domain
VKTSVVTDGGVDVPPDELERYAITVVPTRVIIDGEELRSGLDISSAEFFHRQKTARTLPKTSQPAPEEFETHFDNLLRQSDRIVYVGVSSSLSGTFNSALQAAKQFPPERIILHDTRNATGAAGFQVIAAARAVAAGGTSEEAVAAARQAHDETELYFTVADLTYLIKGGRMGRAVGALGTLLNIRPVISMDKREGVFMPVARVRTFKAATRAVLEHALQAAREPDGAAGGRFLLLYADTEREAAELQEALHARRTPDWFRSMVPTPSILAHSGPSALGLVVAPGPWR